MFRLLTAATPLRVASPRWTTTYVAAICLLPHFLTSTQRPLLSPDDLARRLTAAFIRGDTASFNGMYPFTNGRGLLLYGVRNNLPRRANYRILTRSATDASLLLTGLVDFGNSGDVTGFATAYSGLYRARFTGIGWELDGRIPIDSLNAISGQRISVELLPGRGLRVTDTMTVTVSGPHGFAAVLNHLARIESATYKGRPVQYQHTGGTLWVAARPGRNERLTLRYWLPVELDSTTNPNSGRFKEAFGHVRNQYYWHPLFGFSSAADRAQFTVRVQAPRDVIVATDLPQSDRVSGAYRVTTGSSERPTHAVSLFYDRDWSPAKIGIPGATLGLFTTDDFLPRRDSVVARIAVITRKLGAAVGPPNEQYVAVVQARARGGDGWHFRSNAAIVTGPNGAQMSDSTVPPRDYLGHEVAHGWTAPTGRATNFLSEGWATFAEGMLLGDQFGPEAEANFWESQRNLYETRGYEGRAALADDERNEGVAYHKGAWVFRMLRDFVGDSAFALGLREYIAIPPLQPAGIEELTSALERASHRDVARFLKPWVEGRSIPDLRAEIVHGKLVVSQGSVVFNGPLDVTLSTRDGEVRRTVDLTQAEDTFNLEGISAVHGVTLDPDHRLLRKRHLGERVRFELRSADSTAAQLAGDFTSEPIPAMRTPNGWAVEIEMTEGRYSWRWLTNGRYRAPPPGEPARKGVRLVKPQIQVREAYPR